MGKMYSGRLWIWKKAYDTTDRHSFLISQMLRVYEVGVHTQLLSVNGGRFEINQLLFADVSASG